MTRSETDTPRAVEEVRRVFSRRPRPYGVDYCPCCFDAGEMRELLRKAPEELTPHDLAPILRKAYTTWGNWPALAFYVPRLLEFYANNLLDADLLFYKLLWAARPDLTTELVAAPLDYLEEPMRPEERNSIFQLVQAVARADMRNADSSTGSGRLSETLAFLAAFDAPIAPLFDLWRAEQEPVARGRFCLLIAEYALAYDPAHPAVGNTYLPHIPVLPENAGALAALVAPSFVASYLLENAASAALFEPEYQTVVGPAFDWATTALQHPIS